MLLIGGEKGHALLAARHQQCVEAQFAAQFLNPGSEVRFRCPAPDDFTQFRTVRRDHRRAGVLAPLVALGIDQHRLARRAGQGDHFSDVGQAALAVVGKDHRIAGSDTALEFGQLGLQDFMRGRRLEVDAQQLLLAADDTQFDRGVDFTVDVQNGIDFTIDQQTGQAAPRFVVADHGQQRRSGAQGHRVARDVGGTARAFLDALDLDHRHRRFRRNPADFAEPVAVEHDIADHQQANAPDFVQHLVQRPMAKYSMPADRTNFGS